MRLLLSNGHYFYVEQNDVKLVNIDDNICIVGNTPLYGVDDTGKRYRLNPSSSITRLEDVTSENQLIGSYWDEDTQQYEGVYDDVDVWSLTSITLDGTIPTSMNADDTFNFDNFNCSLLLVFCLAIFVSFRVFSR